MPDVAVVLLAAGASRRMGQPKQLLAYRGRPLVHHAASAMLASPCRPILVVLGAEAERTRAALDGLPVDVVHNPHWAYGVGTSIAAGITAVAARGVSGAVVALADQAGVTAATVDRLLAARAASGRAIVASRYAGTVGVPAYFAAAVFPQLLRLEPDQGCKPLILAAGEHAAHVDCPEAELDVDTEQDYRQLLETSLAL
ncbi:MAG TPA: nucleotidyltransferase family protein [Candidatus Dormibacteraeota bacterium]|nr:nucleotidyltransferase family protein [Candidatus Dormibacteraeota bacterium]